MWLRSLMHVTIVLGTTSLHGLEPSFSHDADGQFLVAPSMLGLPDGNRRSAEPAEVRVYPSDGKGRPNRSNPGPGYPIIVDQQPNRRYELSPGDVAVFHSALDLSSYPGPGEKARSLKFNAGVFGKVIRVTSGDVATQNGGIVMVQLYNDVVIQYHHVAGTLVELGQWVTPETPLGMTGSVGTDAIHLHLQATDSKAQAVDIDQAFLAGRAKPTNATILWPKPAWVDAGPYLLAPTTPKVVMGIVKADDENKRLYYEGLRRRGRFGYDENAPKLPATKKP